MSRRNTSDTDNFFQPLISSLGLFITIVSTFLPFFPTEAVTKYFINPDFVKIASLTSFILGLIIFWVISSLNVSYINFAIGKKDKEGEPWFYVTNLGLFSFFIILNIILVNTFLYLSKFGDSLVYAVIQSAIYNLFFIILVCAFSLIFSFSKSRYEWGYEKDNFHKTILDTLEKNGQVQTGLEIHVNREIAFEEARQLNLGFGLIKHIVVQTVEQRQKKLSCIFSNDGKTLVKVEEINEVSEGIS